MIMNTDTHTKKVTDLFKFLKTGVFVCTFRHVDLTVKNK